jgi:hypothetical protein
MAPPVEECVGMSLKLSLLPIARLDVVSRHCKPIQPDDIDLQATAHCRMVGSALRASHGYRWPSARRISDRRDRTGFKFVDMIGADDMSRPIS